MKDFESIDWIKYNKPPYYQQWLCREDTKKLVTFGDKGLTDVNNQILSLKDQWDLDNVKGYLLDRIGKLLHEYRNGNNDDNYRIFLKLRTILNTNNGGINSIIKAIKFIYTSEVVHIVSNYPAGLIIEHDGEGTPGLNFNKLLAEIIPAGVSFSTKEIFNFKEDMHFFDEEQFVKEITWETKDMFTDTVFRNGRVLRDGTTVFDTQYAPLFRDGSVFRNGSIPERNGYWREPAFGRIKTPIYRRSGIQDFLEIIQSDHATEQWNSYLFRNGSVLRDGSVTRSGQNPHFNDTIKFDTVNSVLQDSFVIEDKQSISVQPQLQDDIGRKYIRNGKLWRTGRNYRSSESIVDVLSMQGAGMAFVDENKSRLIRNGIVTRNGAQFRTGHSMRSMMDRVYVGYYIHHFRNGTYYRDGSVARNSMVFIPA